MPGARGKPPQGTPERRPDIDGLRALAILLVVAYHAHIPGFSAGFVGVDVFFVVSGFLITGLIVAEVDRTGGLRLGAFWIRRARRLLPAATLLISVVLLVNPLVTSPLAWRSTIGEGVAALTYRSNMLFAARATDYFGQSVDASPFLHTWSLAIEEQFYLFWPVVFFVLARLGPGATRSARRTRAAVVAAITAGSLALSVHLTHQGSPDAFFAAASRAWEFGAGALLALGAARFGSLPATARRGLAAGGLGLLGAALVTIGEGTPFPGTAALLPVAGTVALIAAEPAGGYLGRLLAAPPAQFLGRLSYSWYLWHWPVVVLGTGWLQRDSVAVRVALSLAALVPAELTRRLVENPIRLNPTLARSSVASVSVVALVTLGGLGTAGAGEWHAAQVLRDPLLAALDRARSDHVLVHGDCSSTEPLVVTTGCRAGDAEGSGLVLVLGDSHGAHWIPAVDRAARGLGLRVTASVLGNCPSIDVRWNRQVARCTQRQADIGALLDSVDPDLVVVSHSVGYIGGLLRPDGAPVPAERRLGAWQDGLADLARSLRDRDTGLLVVLDTPLFMEDPIGCMADTRSPDDCDASGPRTRALLRPVHDAERAALAAAGHGIAWDPLPRLCADRCPVAVGGLPLYSDTNHLTATFSRSLGADLAGPLLAALDGRAAPTAASTVQTG